MVFTTLLLIFGLLTLLAFGGATAVWLREQRARIRGTALTAAPPANRDTELLFGSLTPGLAAAFPLRGERRDAIQGELREAGFYHAGALQEYEAIRVALIMLPLLFGAIFTVLSDRDQIPAFAIGTLIVTGAGASLPRYYILARGRARAGQIERGLPFALDLINLGLSAGQTIFAAIASACDKIRKPFPVLAKELEIVREQAELSNLPLALRHFADRTNVPDVRNLSMVLVQSEQLGTDVSNGLLEFSNNLRTNLRHRAEAQANRANFWMLIPTIGCLWLAAAMMLVLPIYHDFTKKRDDARAILTTGSETLLKSQSDRGIKAKPDEQGR